ncbi:MAG: UDP-N-acetylglucosamine--N-acetylmuramyl-(pentapeptide) pyrophosphoryl-undecaprenol N-acetylglucosamine transferase [Oligoflexia bacterium]|nr:MAG: UDP-N-acetylglucosamine--N-acetylmuramyl-(pentapeptide) pyrophosphoryl-undecaprenol N-acetylglucosamine transferase [Oligoflexia bacterium]
MNNNIVIAGGGTGGHIYPGVAIARAIQKHDPTVHIHFVGTSTGLETKIIPKEGFPLHLIQGGKLNFSGGIGEKIKTLIKLPIGLIQSFILLLKLKPSFVLGVGGYASGPFVVMAALMGYPSAIWEPNAHPGMANRWLSRFVDRCYIVFDQAKTLLKNKNIIQFGMPIRAEIEAGQFAERQDSDFHLLSFGGSQGSRAISTVLSDLLLRRPDWAKDLKVVHQIGSTDWEKMRAKYKGTEDFITPMEFIYDMPKYYAWADLVVSRAGASTLSELAAFGVVSIVIPLPAADDHQKHNADALVQAGAAVMILQKDLTPETLQIEIQKLKNNPELRKKMSESLKKFYIPKSADNIAQDILSIQK